MKIIEKIKKNLINKDFRNAVFFVLFIELLLALVLFILFGIPNLVNLFYPQKKNDMSIGDILTFISTILAFAGSLGMSLYAVSNSNKVSEKIENDKKIYSDKPYLYVEDIILDEYSSGDKISMIQENEYTYIQNNKNDECVTILNLHIKNIGKGLAIDTLCDTEDHSNNIVMFLRDVGNVFLIPEGKSVNLRLLVDEAGIKNIVFRYKNIYGITFYQKLQFTVEKTSIQCIHIFTIDVPTENIDPEIERKLGVSAYLRD